MNIDSNSKVHVFKFVLTGGPCSGKTSAFAAAREYLVGQGYRVYMVPEAATMLFINGVSFGDLDIPKRKYAMQQSVLYIQTQLEDSFENVARSTGQKCVLLCDRGNMDGSAYMDRDDFVRILKEQDKDITDVREGRYDGIMHLVSAADGAGDFYSLENNKARSEDLVSAVEVDVANQYAWSGHPHHFIFDNSHPSFDLKLDALVSRIAGCLGLPHPRHRAGDAPPTTSYALLEPPSEDSYPSDTKASDYTITYLRTSIASPEEVVPDLTNSRYGGIGLSYASIVSDVAADAMDSTGHDFVVDPKTEIIFERRVVSRYVIRRVPTPLQRTRTPPTPSRVHPLVSPPSKEFPVSVKETETEGREAGASYELTIIRKILNDAHGYFKVHMTINQEDYNALIQSQRDESRREVHQKRFHFINGRQPITVIQNVDPWLIELCAAPRPASSSTSFPSPVHTWVKICTEGTPVKNLPDFLKIGGRVRNNALEFGISELARHDN